MNYFEVQDWWTIKCIKNHGGIESTDLPAKRRQGGIHGDCFIFYCMTIG
jgi:hypothetical protein